MRHFFLAAIPYVGLAVLILGAIFALADTSTRERHLQWPTVISSVVSLLVGFGLILIGVLVP